MSDVIYNLQARHTRNSPVFVVGFPRSGTGLTCSLLRRYLKVSFGTESEFVIRYLRRLPQFGDLKDEVNVRRLLYEIGTERFFVRSRHNCGFEFDVDKAIRTLASPTYAGVLHSIFGQLAEHNGMVRWGDRAAYNSDLHQIRQLFPDAQFIHVVRDGRDVSLSFRSESSGARNACETAEDWNRTLESIQAFSRDLPRDQYFEVRYEDLTGQTSDAVGALGDFLGVDDDDRALRDYVSSNVGAEIKSGNSGKWCQSLTPRDVERFEGVAVDMLVHFGYHLAYQGQARPVSTLERRFWQLRGRTDRWLMRRYWRDNFYRLKIRVRSLVRPGTLGRATTGRTSTVVTTQT